MTQQQTENSTAQYTNLDLEFEPDYSMVWAKFKYSGRPCMNRGLIGDVGQAQTVIAEKARNEYEHSLADRLKYQVFCSDLPGVFNLGGDLAYFVQLIRQKNRDALSEYASTCIDILYRNATNYEIPFTTIALVQGETLGGGFEAALSANVIIAEKHSRFGFPETVFGMFPGMGAFSFLARKVAPGLAKRMITSGKVYTAKELYDLGVVDILVPDGYGKEAVYDYIQQQRHRSTGLYGLDRVIEQFNPLSHKELLDVTKLWVDTALQLSEKNIRLMEYLVRAQEKRWCGNDEPLVSMAG